MNIESQIQFFQKLRKTFITCPCCGTVYRLSDSNLFNDASPKKDWKIRLDEERERISKREEKLKSNIAKLKNDAKDRGRQTAISQTDALDSVFAPIGLKAIDCKNICDPVDFIVFNGMHAGNLKNLIMLDRRRDDKIQQSIRNTIENELYSWETIRVNSDGTLQKE